MDEEESMFYNKDKLGEAMKDVVKYTLGYLCLLSFCCTCLCLGGARSEWVQQVTFHPNIDLSVKAFMLSLVSFSHQSHKVNCSNCQTQGLVKVVSIKSLQ